MPHDDLPFDLRALRIFVAVCEAGGMAAAARRLGLTQPAVSQCVGELEARLGVTLVDRGVRPVALTPEGATLRGQAAGLLSEAGQIAPLLREVRRGRVQSLRIGLVDSLARALLGPLTEHARKIAVQTRFLSGLTGDHARALTERRLDLFLGVDDLGEEPGLARWRLLREAYVLIAPPGLPSPADLASLRTLLAQVALVRYGARSQSGIDVERHLNRLRVDASAGLQFDTPYGLAAAVAAGAGIALTTRLCLHEAALPPGAVAVHPLPGPRLVRDVTLVARRGELGRVPEDIAALAKPILRRLVPSAGPSP